MRKFKKRVWKYNWQKNKNGKNYNAGIRSVVDLTDNFNLKHNSSNDFYTLLSHVFSFAFLFVMNINNNKCCK